MRATGRCLGDFPATDAVEKIFPATGVRRVPRPNRVLPGTETRAKRILDDEMVLQNDNGINTVQIQYNFEGRGADSPNGSPGPIFHSPPGTCPGAAVKYPR